MRHDFRRNNKAVSAVFGMIFFLLIVVVAFASFSMVLDRSINLENTMIDMREVDNQKAHEAMVLKTPPPYDGHSVTYLINNTGTVSTRVVRLWVEDITNGKSGSYAVPVNEQNLQPNEQRTFTGAITVAGANALTDTFRYWFVTARGNQFTILLQGAKGPDGANGIDGRDGSDGKAQVANGVGYLSFDFESVTYFTVSNGKLTPYPSGNRAYSMPASMNIAIGFNVTFMNQNYDYTIDRRSNLWTYFGGVPGHTLGQIWLISSNTTDTLDATYKPITLQFNQTRFIIFRYYDGRYDTQHIGAIAAVNLLFYGDLKVPSTNTVVKSYGQNVPFVSIEFTQP